MAYDSIPLRVQGQASARGGAPAYFEKQGGEWRPTSWSRYAEEVKLAAKALLALGFHKGQTTCVLGANRPEWTIFALGTMSAGGAPAGIYTTNSPDEVQYIVHHAESPVVLVENSAQWEKVKSVRDRLPHLKKVVIMKGATADDPMVVGWDAFLASGREISDEAFLQRLHSIEPHDLAVLIYTSGTTGPPKGVMLSHENLAWTAKTASKLIPVTPADRLLSYLPLSHIAEQVFTVHGGATHGYAVYYVDDLAKLPESLTQVKPTVLFAVPRVWEKFHAKISEKLGQARGVKKTLAGWSMRVGREVNLGRLRGQEPSGLLGLKYALASKLVFSKLKAALGLSELRVAASGAAPISREVLEFFLGLDLRIHEVYGQSEGTGPSTFNNIGNTKLGTVGTVLAGGELKIAEDGEILYRGPNVFLGYFKEPEATAETRIDGWLHSGDLGQVDADGFLSITGRKKEIIITAGGKNIAPKNIEASLKQIELVNEAVVIGDRRKYLTALVTLEPEASARFAQEHGLDAAKLHESPVVRDLIQKGVDEMNQQYARVEQVKKFAILPRNLTIDDGELTPTMKVKRKVVKEHFAREIEAMYEETSSAKAG
jgi:long-chain acyl-CoA synthetase